MIDKKCPVPLLIKGQFQTCYGEKCQAWNREKQECLIISTLLAYRTLSNASIQMINYAQKFSDMCDKMEVEGDEGND